ncbi:MAG: transposase family protein [Planctomycetota bacterium]|nr:transposase family protein [Planctomycetota bacterium]
MHERFEVAHGIDVICRPIRRRAGQTAQGFHKALPRLPLRPLVALTAAVRHRPVTLLGDDLVRHGFIPLGCDGPRLGCARVIRDELECRESAGSQQELSGSPGPMLA